MTREKFAWNVKCEAGEISLGRSAVEFNFRNFLSSKVNILKISDE